jgi:hypothetical protein
LAFLSPCECRGGFDVVSMRFDAPIRRAATRRSARNTAFHPSCTIRFENPTEKGLQSPAIRARIDMVREDAKPGRTAKTTSHASRRFNAP